MKREDKREKENYHYNNREKKRKIGNICTKKSRKTFKVTKLGSLNYRRERKGHVSSSLMEEQWNQQKEVRKE